MKTTLRCSLLQWGVGKHFYSPEEIERRSLASEQFKTIFNIHRIEKTKKLYDW